ncbi:MAG: hypothetical protein PVH61_16490 [Candidatus Aminicenantes bacterium]|jgi:UDP-glucose 4-epimerase
MDLDKQNTYLVTGDAGFIGSNIVAAILLTCTAEGIGGGLFNIACGERYTLLHPVDALNRILGTNLEPLFEEERPGDVKHSLAGISRAGKKLGFQVNTHFEQGLTKLVKEMNG